MLAAVTVGSLILVAVAGSPGMADAWGYKSQQAGHCDRGQAVLLPEVLRPYVAASMIQY